jgi:hypothetical protein
LMPPLIPMCTKRQRGFAKSSLCESRRIIPLAQSEINLILRGFADTMENATRQ